VLPLTPQSGVLEKLIDALLVKSLPAFYETPRFITVFLKSLPLNPILGQMNPIYIHTHTFLQITL